MSAHYYQDPEYLVDIKLSSDKFFVYQYDEMCMVLDKNQRYVYFDIDIITDDYEIADETGKVWKKDSNDYFIRAYHLYSNKAIVLYVPRGGVWDDEALEKVPEEMYDSMDISLG